MGRRWDGTRPTLAERSAARTGAGDRPAEDPARSRPVGLRHCWVAGLPDLPGRHAGLLVEWRRAEDRQWLARVVYAVVDGDSPVLIEAWVGAGHLSPAP